MYIATTASPELCLDRRASSLLSPTPSLFSRVTSIPSSTSTKSKKKAAIRKETSLNYRLKGPTFRYFLYMKQSQPTICIKSTSKKASSSIYS